MNIGTTSKAIMVKRIGGPAQPKQVEAPKPIEAPVAKTERELATA